MHRLHPGLARENGRRAHELHPTLAHDNGVTASHVRWHVNRGVRNLDKCTLCRRDEYLEKTGKG